MSKKFQMPDSLDGLSIDALLELRSAAKAAVAELIKDEAPSDEQVAEAEAIVESMNTIDARVTDVRAEETARAERLAKVRAKADEEDEAPEAEPEAEVETPEPEAEAEVEVKIEEMEPVAAGATITQSAVARAAANATEPEAPMNKQGMVITAAADLAGYSAGSTLETAEAVAKAALKRLSTFPKSGGAKTRLRQGIAEFNLAASRTDGMVQGNPEYKTDQDVLVAAASQERLGEGGIVAAGGWCAPAEVITDFCSEVSTDGILSLPSMTVNSGSVRYTKGPDFGEIFANANGDWNLTEAQVIADTQKPCIAVECPDWDDLTLDVTGVCISAGILTNSAYPELVRAYVDNVLIAHQHKIATRLYAGIDAASTQLTGVTGLSEVDGLSALELVTEYVKSSKRMAMSTTWEVLLPAWYKASVKRDIANRSGVNPWQVTDAQVEALFRARGYAVQWLYNTAQDITRAVNALTVPATVDALFYKPGTFVRLGTDLITLDGVYDSTQLKTNTYTALFTEEGIGLAQMCGDSYKVELPVCGMGQAGALDLTCTTTP